MDAGDSSGNEAADLSGIQTSDPAIASWFLDVSLLPKESEYYVAVRARRRGHRHKYRVRYDGSVWEIVTGGFYENRQRTRTRIGEILWNGAVSAASVRALQIMKKIVKDPALCCHRYARSTGRCLVCGALLENRESVRLGIGPVCREKHAWVMDLIAKGNLSDESDTDTDCTQSEGYDSMTDFVVKDDEVEASPSEDGSESSTTRRRRLVRPRSSKPADGNELDAILEVSETANARYRRGQRRKRTINIHIVYSESSGDEDIEFHVRRARRTKRRRVSDGKRPKFELRSRKRLHDSDDE